MIASAYAVCYTGAMPVFVDSDRQTWNIDVSKIEEKITPRTKAIMPVHIFGQMCDMDPIVEISRKHNLFIVEDAAEAHGAEYKGKKSGSFSDVGAFSFFANKNITTGEGGMVVTNNENLYNKFKYYKNMCFPLNGIRNYSHENIGFNYRMSNVIAAIGLAQIEKADEYRSMRIENNSLYRDFLKDVPGIKFQNPSKNGTDVCWMNAIVVEPYEYRHTKDELTVVLKQNNIETRLLFNGMHNQKSMADYSCDCNDSYPVCDWLTANGFYLPSASNLNKETIKWICTVIKDFQKL